MEDKIYLAELESYQYATEEQKKRFGKNPCFDLMRLPTQTMREELRTYILRRSREITIISLYDERKEYSRLCRFLEKKGRVESLKDKEKEIWIRQLRGWMMSEGIPLTREEKGAFGKKKVVKSDFISFFERVLDSLLPGDNRSETEKDVWRLDGWILRLRRI
ncbi:hypothetical protein [Petralouisia muris]|uniref:hypothetical protein n=1 Tax=Petralouisia muris TaxID=3032872 RepID=UPI0026CC03B2